MPEDREQKIKDRAHRLWEDEGRPEGRELEHWREAERQVLAEEAAEWRPEAPDDASADARVTPPADPLRNPEPIPPAEDPEYPAITGPEQLPPGMPIPVSLNPEEVERVPAAPEPAGSSSGVTRAAGVKRRRAAKTPVRRRPDGSTLEP
ncbi:MAG TPA: DUF2934 domain-containing protein [Geminicoccaceae bacterium]|nr:DUF2934 domain-containing protein [Geminicoccaceae bacterium]